jgi:hypothetical protein
MTLSKKEQELVYIALITRTQHIEKLIHGWKSYEKRDELEEGLIETYSTELAKLNEIKEKIVSNA